MRDRKGFTLVELLLVSLLIVILVGISTPQFREALHTIQLDNTTNTMAKLMMYARERAVVESRKYRMVIVPEKESYWLEVNSDPLLPDTFAPLKEDVAAAQVIPSYVTIETKRQKVVFYPDGRIDKTTLYIKDASDRTYTITTDEDIGHVSVYNYRLR